MKAKDLKIGELYCFVIHASAPIESFSGECKNIRAGDILFYVKKLNVLDGFYMDFYLFLDRDGDKLVLDHWQLGFIKRI